MPKTSSIRSAVLAELRLVTDGRTDRHRAMASTADAEMAYSLSNYRRVTNIRIIAHFTHLRKFRNFVFATEVTIFSDHNALVYLRECAPKSAKNSCMLILIFLPSVL